MSRNQDLTYGTEVESFHAHINTKESVITFTTPVFGFVIYAQTVDIQYEIDDPVDDDSMYLPAGEREPRHVLTTTIAVRSVAGDGVVYISGHR